jgi:hypothetical protein
MQAFLKAIIGSSPSKPAEISEAKLACLFNAMRTNTNVVKVAISNQLELSWDAAAELSKMIAENKTIETLSKNGILRTAVKQIASALCWPRNFEGTVSQRQQKMKLSKCCVKHWRRTGLWNHWICRTIGLIALGLDLSCRRRRSASLSGDDSP